VFQIGTAKYGVRNADGTLNEERVRELSAIPQVRMFEVKLTQGAKPGKGGILPGIKVTSEIAEIRGIPAGQDLNSPNRHPEINSNAELLDFIARIKALSGKPVGIKAVIGAYGWIDELMAMINARGDRPDFFTLDSGDGGTGAAPMALIDNVGLPIRESLPLLRDIIDKHGLGERIPIIASGKLTTPADVAWALCAGATFVNSARGFMFALGCIQSLKFNRNTCPTGITTHDKRLQMGLDPTEKSVRVANYCANVKHDVETIAHSCGVPIPDAFGACTSALSARTAPLDRWTSCTRRTPPETANHRWAKRSAAIQPPTAMNPMNGGPSSTASGITVSVNIASTAPAANARITGASAAAAPRIKLPAAALMPIRTGMPAQIAKM